jgi:hypothetical protein
MTAEVHRTHVTRLPSAPGRSFIGQKNKAGLSELRHLAEDVFRLLICSAGWDREDLDFIGQGLGHIPSIVKVLRISEVRRCILNQEDSSSGMLFSPIHGIDCGTKGFFE